jgi:diaminohydroxyphosphoribosylaminopyrimidine deaminase/5-amino-6-(5-phosphoribosylamino)uracil reductase
MMSTVSFMRVSGALNGRPCKPSTTCGPLARGLRRVYVEGGPTIVSAVIAAGFADELSVYLAPMLLGGGGLALGELGIPTIAQALRLRLTAIEQLGDDLHVIARPATPASPKEN